MCYSVPTWMTSTSSEDFILSGSGDGAYVQLVTLALVNPALDRLRRRCLFRGRRHCGRCPSDVYGDTDGVAKTAGQTLRLVDYRRIDPTPG